MYKSFKCFPTAIEMNLGHFRYISIIDCSDIGVTLTYLIHCLRGNQGNMGLLFLIRSHSLKQWGYLPKLSFD